MRVKRTNFSSGRSRSKFKSRQTLRGSSSIRKATYDDAAVAKLPYTPAFLASVPIAKPKPTVPESDAMTQAAVRRLSEIVSGQTSAQQGLDALAVEMQRILKGKARLRYPVKATR